MSQLTAQLTEVQDIVNQLSLIERNHFIAKTDRHEDVAEHSLSVAMFAWYLHHYTKSKLDIARIQEYAIVHDFVEIHAGNVNTFAEARERAAKEERELAALKKFTSDFANFPRLVSAMENYQTMADAEAWFVWTADKIQALIQGNSDNWRPYYAIGITNGQFARKYDELLAKVPSDLQPLFKEVIAWCKETYDYR